MPYPLPLSLSYSYTGFQQGQGDNSFPGTQLDADLQSIKANLDSVRSFLVTGFAADGKVKPTALPDLSVLVANAEESATAAAASATTAATAETNAEIAETNAETAETAAEAALALALVAQAAAEAATSGKADLTGADFTGPVTVPTPAFDDDSEKAVTSAYIARMRRGTLSVEELDADDTGTNDSTTAFNGALTEGSAVWVPPGSYRLNSAINPISHKEMYGVRGASILKQYGTQLFVQDTAGLENFHLHDLKLDYEGGSASHYVEAFNLGAHRKCILENLDFEGYGDATIMFRSPYGFTPTHNGVDNLYKDWYLPACWVLDICIGQEVPYFRFQGDGSTTVINTGIAWPETVNSSVAVLQEATNRTFTQLTLGTHYTVSYDGSDILTITMVSAPTALQRIHIWPAQPVSTGRRPYSNNVWENIRCEAVGLAGRVAVRWVDAETFRFDRLVAVNNQVRLCRLNPYTNRTGQAGDHFQWDNCIYTYNPVLVDSPSTLHGIHAGPGSEYLKARGQVMDLLWRHSGTNKAITILDTREVAMTGTVAATNGSPTITGTGTAFEDELALIGALKDNIKISGVLYGITSIDSDTQVTLATNYTGSTASGLSIARFNLENGASYDFDFASAGEPNTNASSRDVARYAYRSRSNLQGTATIANGNTSIAVTHEAARTPLISEISVAAADDLGGRSVHITSITATSFTINVDTAVGGDTDFGWQINLGALN